MSEFLYNIRFLFTFQFKPDYTNQYLQSFLDDRKEVSK